MSQAVKVLDSWALIAFLEDEPAAAQVESLLTESTRTSSNLLITTVNLGEIWYALARSYSAQVADEAVQRILSLGITVTAVSWELAYLAAQIKAKGNIGYADCFAAALAVQETAELVTGDPEFKQLEGQIKIMWLQS